MDDTPKPKRLGLLAGFVPESELAADLDKDIRTLQRWRKLRVGPPFILVGNQPFYSIEKARGWLVAGGTGDVSGKSIKKSDTRRKNAGSRS